MSESASRCRWQPPRLARKLFARMSGTRKETRDRFAVYSKAQSLHAPLDKPRRASPASPARRFNFLYYIYYIQLESLTHSHSHSHSQSRQVLPSAQHPPHPPHPPHPDADQTIPTLGQRPTRVLLSHLRTQETHIGPAAGLYCVSHSGRSRRMQVLSSLSQAQ